MEGENLLIIGGTGMLCELSESLSSKNKVYVVGRTEGKMQSLQKRAPEIQSVIADYTEDKKFEKEIKAVFKKADTINTVISWMHQSGSNAHEIIFKELNKKGGKYFHVVSHQWGLAGAPENPVKKTARNYPDVKYIQVILGWKFEKGKKRWLHDEEICAGLKAALATEDDVVKVGDVR